MLDMPLLRGAIASAENYISSKMQEHVLTLEQEELNILWLHEGINFLDERTPKVVVDAVREFWRNNLNKQVPLEFILECLNHGDHLFFDTDLVFMYRFIEHFGCRGLGESKKVIEDLLRQNLNSGNDPQYNFTLMNAMNSSVGLRRAFKEEIKRYLDHLCKLQSADGQWCFWGDSLNMNICCAFSLSQYLPSSVEVKRAIEWILQRRNTDGSWERMSILPFSLVTANSMIAVIMLNSGYSLQDLTPTINWILSAQRRNGLWDIVGCEELNNRTTFLAVKALKLAQEKMSEIVTI